MRKGIGIGCVVLGIACLLTSIGFIIYNRCEQKNGETMSQALLQNVQLYIQEAEPMESISPENIPEETLTEEVPDFVSQKMQTVPAGEYESIGILSIPVLELELPVLTDWSYAKLKQAPCHYYGSYYESDFVIAAHNYTSHFGRLSQLQAGDLVLFTDVTGKTYYYEVVLLETLIPTATEEMITSGFDLSLYTCTPGGGNRVTVRCNKADN